MDVSKYKDGFELTEVSNENGILYHRYINKEYNVAYNRLAWTNSFKKDELDLLRKILFSQVEFLSKVLPNVVKVEMGDNHMEALYFDNDDIEFNLIAVLNPILTRLVGNRLTIRNLMDNEDDYNEAMDILLDDEEYISAVKNVYKEFLDKEL